VKKNRSWGDLLEMLSTNRCWETSTSRQLHFPDRFDGWVAHDLFFCSGRQTAMSLACRWVILMAREIPRKVLVSSSDLQYNCHVDVP